MNPDAATIETLRTQYADCFGCGLENAVGLQLDGFEISNTSVTAPFRPRDQFAGFAGILHGGIVATALDEISAWSAMLTEGVFVFTAKLDLRFRKQATIGSDFLLNGSVVERSGKRLTIESQLTDNETVIAQSHGVFVVAGEVTSTVTHRHLG